MKGVKRMKIKFNINKDIKDECAEFWLKKMTAKIDRISKELSSNNDFLWCYQDRNITPVNFDEIYLIQIEDDKTQVFTANEKYFFKGRLYQVEQELPSDFIESSRSAVINYHKIHHLEILDNGNIDVIMKNKLRVQISRRKIKTLKERLGI